VRQFTENFYQGEHLFYGHFGHLLIIISFVTALFTFIIGLKTFLAKDKKTEDFRMVRSFFQVHAISVLAIFGLLIYLFYGHFFEYHYIWRHSSLDLPWYFIFSAIWEGQEGSFILWIIWHAILGLVLLRNLTQNKLGALAILGLVQAFLLTMILGVDVFGKLIGSNPFILLRDELSIPILSNPNYLELIKDGNGLNILLQNYWMTIHPPVLFLGFASTTIPFGFAVASLIRRDFTSWTKEAQPWSLFGFGVLGLGILMGGRWAYEALSFGGFWAWDPVENASLVPWLFLAAGVHTLMIYRATQHSLRATYIFLILAFGFVLYSTFLTRSGILGDSSVHSFTDLGMTGQLLIFLGTLLIPSFLLLAYNWSKIPQNEKEENTWSREFWMFLGSLFIVVSALQVTFSTSIPVWNKLYDLKLAPPINANEHYNSIQIWFAMVVCFLMSGSLWILYRDTKKKSIFKTLSIHGIVTLGVAILTIALRDIPAVQQYSFVVADYKIKFKFISSYFFLMWSSLLLVISSTYYIFTKLKDQNKWAWGGSIAHLGFGLLVLGALISQYEKKPISVNQAGIDFGKEMNIEEQSSNSLLMPDTKEKMGNYTVSYLGKSPIKQGEKYRVKFVETSNPTDSFVLEPEARMIKEGMGSRLNPEPSIEHLWGKDIFVHVTSVPQDNTNPKAESKALSIGDTFYAQTSQLIFDTVQVKPANTKDQIDIVAVMRRVASDKNEEIIQIPYRLNTSNGEIFNPVVSSQDGSIKVNLGSINPQVQKFEFSILDTNKPQDWIILKAIEFPHIRILWIGCILMTIGTIMSAWYRRNKKTK
jgi:cytochrome c-type biogenesis protein CcmF